MKKKTGFTLVEMLITIAIMGVLALAALPNVNLRDNSQAELAITVRQVADQINLVKTWSQTGTIPNNQDLNIPIDKYKITILDHGLELAVHQTTGDWQVVGVKNYDGYDFDKITCQLIFDPTATALTVSDQSCLSAGDEIFVFSLTKQSNLQRQFIEVDLRTGLVSSL